MKKNDNKDYDIFNEVTPFDVRKLLKHMTTEERNKTFVPIQGGYQAGLVVCHHPIYNTDTKIIEWTKPDNYLHRYGGWHEITDPKTIESSTLQYAPTYYEAYQSKISSAKAALKKAQEVKEGEFSYLWKENSVQTQIDIEEQSVQTKQVIAEVSTQTKEIAIDVSTQTDSDVDLPSKEMIKEKEMKLTKFVSEFYNKFSDNEEVEAFYNKFLDIMDESQLSGEDNSNTDYYE